MDWKKIGAIFVIIGLIIWALVDIMNHHQTGTEVGDEAPNFSLQSIDGEMVNLSDYKGKKVVINFWATWCPPCVEETFDLQNFYNDYKDQEFVILGLNQTQTEKSEGVVKYFVDYYHVTYPILLDKSGSVSNLYKVKGYPTTYFIDSNGIIRKKIVGPVTYETLQSIIDNLD